MPDIGEFADAAGTRAADALPARLDGWTALFATCGPSASPTEEAPTAAGAAVAAAAVGEAPAAVAAFDAMFALEEPEEPASTGVAGVPEVPDELFVVSSGSLLVFAVSPTEPEDD